MQLLQLRLPTFKCGYKNCKKTSTSAFVTIALTPASKHYLWHSL